MKALDDVQKKAAKNQRIALKLIANEYKNDVQNIAPYLSGTLKRSIHVEEAAPDRMLVGTDVPYARRLEYGFVDKDKLGRSYHQAPRPYFRPAMDNNANKYRQMFLDGMMRQ